VKKGWLMGAGGMGNPQQLQMESFGYCLGSDSEEGIVNPGLGHKDVEEVLHRMGLAVGRSLSHRCRIPKNPRLKAAQSAHDGLAAKVCDVLDVLNVFEMKNRVVDYVVLKLGDARLSLTDQYLIRIRNGSLLLGQTRYYLSWATVATPQ